MAQLTPATALAILREAENSPNRESDDSLILRAVARELETLKIPTRVLSPRELDAETLEGSSLVLPMCESYPRLKRLMGLKGRPGVRIINEPAAVLDTYRTRMVEILGGAAGVRFPETAVRPVRSPACEPPPAFASGGTWIKRGDVHNTTLRDVVFARTHEEREAVRQDFASREISHMVLQRHVDGDLVKFYGVGPGQWFTWFYHDPDTARRLPFALEELSRSAEAAARAIGLEVFGGDAIISSDGPIFVIDVNSWPSFARVREEAARQIARHAAARARERSARR